MLRKWNEKDHDAVMQLWLIGNIEEHPFISAKYWKENFKEVERIIAISETLVYEHQGKVKGFISAMEGYIVGLFVDKELRRHGMGLVMLDRLKEKEDEIYVNLYEKNEGAVRFFMKQGFKIQAEVIDESTKEKQFTLSWEKKDD